MAKVILDDGEIVEIDQHLLLLMCVSYSNELDFHIKLNAFSKKDGTFDLGCRQGLVQLKSNIDKLTERIDTQVLPTQKEGLKDP